MKIVKSVSLALIEVDPDKGILWLNCPNCVIRCQGLKFQTKTDKFSMIDIHKDNAYMIEGNLSVSKYHDFIEKLHSLLLSCNATEEEMEDVYQYILLHKNKKEKV